MEIAVVPLIEPFRGALDELCRRFRVETLALFGSVVTSEFDPEESDLDFVVRFQPMSPREHADAYFGLLGELESLFARKVDLVEEEAIENPYFRRSVESTRRTIYDAA